MIGVEFAPELHRIAEENIRRYANPARRCSEVRSVGADAARFDLPQGDCVLYFNNPFAEPVFNQVLANVRAAYERERPRIYVRYQQLAGDLEAAAVPRTSPCSGAHRSCTNARLGTRHLSRASCSASTTCGSEASRLMRMAPALEPFPN